MAVSYDQPVIPYVPIVWGVGFLGRTNQCRNRSATAAKDYGGRHAQGRCVNPRIKDAAPFYLSGANSGEDLSYARFEYDVFLAMAMAGLDTEEQYQS